MRPWEGLTVDPSPDAIIDEKPRKTSMTFPRYCKLFCYAAWNWTAHQPETAKVQ